MINHSSRLLIRNIHASPHPALPGKGLQHKFVVVLPVSGFYGVNDDFKGFHGKVLSEGEITSHQGLNLPGATLSLRSPTKTDINGIKFGVNQHIDWFALSFIRDRRDVENTQKAIEQAGGDQPIISKIEHRDAIDNIDEIIEASDGIMVARGDLGIEIPPWEVPTLQKSIISKCNSKLPSSYGLSR